MNDHFTGEGDAATLREIVMRAEFLRRSELWTTALAYALLLLVGFLALVVVFELAKMKWPELAAIDQSPWLHLSRLALLAMAAWIFVSAARRGAHTRKLELDLLRSEIHELQKRLPHY